MNESGTLNIKYQLRKGDFTSHIELTLPTKGVTAIFGASGSGKTTLLRFIAGLEDIPGGHIEFKSDTWQNHRKCVPTHKRPISYVFQEASLFPHLTVEHNLLYGYKRKPAAKQYLDVNEVISLLGLESFIHRYPSQLSGGQRQRVAIARALLAMPQLLLMDEPLAALDANSKTDILPYLEKLHEELSIPILYVSHSVHEVVRIADHMVLLESGAVVKTGPVNELMTNPSLSLAKLEEACAVLEGTIEAHDDQYHLTYLKVSAGIFTISQQQLPIGKAVRIRILARDVSLTKSKQVDTSVSNILPVEITDFFPTNDPAHTMVRLNAGGSYLLSRITLRSKEKLDLKQGQIIYAQIKSVSLLRGLPS